MHSLVFCILLGNLAQHLASRLVSLEPDQDVDKWRSDGWQKLQRVLKDKPLHLTFALKNRNIGKLENTLLDVSNPKSSNYGKYLSVDDITEMVSPSKYTHLIVSTWLLSNGVQVERDCELNRNRDMLVCVLSCEVVESLLPGTVFHYFKHSKASKPVIRSDSAYYVPDFVSKHLDFIGGIHRFPAVNWGKTNDEERRKKEARAMNEAVGAGVHVGVYPKVIRERYGIAPDEVGSHPNNTQACSQFLEQFYSPADLTEFFSMFVGNEFKHVKDMAKVIGPDTGRSGLEASLDTQYLTSIGANIPTWFWSTAGRHDNQEPFLTWLYAMGNTTTVPWVNSVSYGEEEVTLSVAYMQRVSVEFMKAGVRGITLLFASGDDGASCKKGKFSPAFPGSSPYVTTVGGSGFKNPFSVGDEKGVDFSGGGFSNVFPQPAYQNGSIALYLKIGNNIPDEKYFNKSGRAYPDVAALGRHYWIINNRVPFPGVMGTSASTPVTAGIISLINDKRLTASKPPMGFLNPFLYQNAHVLNDIVDGYNEGCQAHDIGFYAGEKWDPVTGHGSPMYHPLLEAAMAVVGVDARKK